MLEILFRGKALDNGEWVYGSLVEMGPVGFVRYFILPNYSNTFDFVEVDPLTVGQYIGLTDINGMKIFEGSIVRSHERVCEVRYSSEWARFHAVLPNLVVNPTAFRNCEVIGNIHDNPELLEGGGEKCMK